MDPLAKYKFKLLNTYTSEKDLPKMTRYKKMEDYQVYQSPSNYLVFFIHDHKNKKYYEYKNESSAYAYTRLLYLIKATLK